jgi:tripartite-type tricarboxylate transporter receptor subunit TctC
VWPSKPVTVVVPFAAGGNTDVLARIFAERMSRRLGQQFVIENKAGAGGTTGIVSMTKAPADGYTLAVATTAGLASNAVIMKDKLGYNAEKDIAYLYNMATQPNLMVVHPSVPAKTLPELFAYDKANPGKLTFATDGPRNFSGIIAAWITKLGGANILQVPYATMPQGVQDTIAGRTQVTILAVPSAAPHIGSGALRPLAVSSLQRLSNYPDVPPISDTFPGVEVIGWFTIAAPARTPRDAVVRMNQELDKILKDPEVVQQLATVGFFTEGAGTPDETRDFVKAQYDLWGKVTREIGLQPE